MNNLLTAVTAATSFLQASAGRILMGKSVSVVEKIIERAILEIVSVFITRLNTRMQATAM